MPISNITNGESGSDTRTSLNQVIDKVNGIEAAADVTDAGNVGPAIGGATVITTLGDTDQLPVVQSNVLKSITYAALKALLGALYQAKATILSTFAGLSNSAGQLTNDGAGNLSWVSGGGGGGIGGSTGSTANLVLVSSGTGGATVAPSITYAGPNTGLVVDTLGLSFATASGAWVLGGLYGQQFLSTGQSEMNFNTGVSDYKASPDLTLSATRLSLGALLKLKGYTVGTLPTGTQGDTAFVTDALTPVSLATVTAGGVVVVKVFYNGTNWIVQ